MSTHIESARRAKREVRASHLSLEKTLHGCARFFQLSWWKALLGMHPAWWDSLSRREREDLIGTAAVAALAMAVLLGAIASRW